MQLGMDRMLEFSPKVVQMILVALRHYEDQMRTVFECKNLMKVAFTKTEAAKLSDDIDFVRSLIGRLER
jgi:hypothetical protein